jgi:hypothetical protein
MAIQQIQPNRCEKVEDGINRKYRKFLPYLLANQNDCQNPKQADARDPATVNDLLTSHTTGPERAYLSPTSVTSIV